MFASFDGGLALQVGARVIEAAVCVGLGWVIVRLARLGVFTDEQGVAFRNVFRTDTARWDEIACFEPPAEYGKALGAGLIARLDDGRTLSATGISRGPLEGPMAAQTVTDYLNEMLRQQRGNQHP